MAALGCRADNQTASRGLQKEAIRYIAEFFGLDALPIIDLTHHAVSQADGAAMLWEDFTVVGSEIPHGINHSGVVPIEQNPAGACVDAAIFERLEAR